MKIVTTQHGAVTVVKPQGSLAQSDAEVLASRLPQCISESRGRVVLDLASAPFLDSTALEALADAGQELGRAGQKLRVCGVGPNVREAMELTDVDTWFDFFDDVSSAVRSFL